MIKMAEIELNDLEIKMKKMKKIKIILIPKDEADKKCDN